MFIKYMLIFECIWLFLSSSVVCLFFDTLYFSFFTFFNFSNVLSGYLNLRVYLLVLVFVVEVLFRLIVFSGNLLADDVHSSVAVDRHVQACQWTGSISLLTWGLLWGYAYWLEAWRCTLAFLLLSSKLFKRFLKIIALAYICQVAKFGDLMSYDWKIY